MRGEFLRLVRSTNESLRLITIYYSIKLTFGIKTTLLESLRCQKKPFKSSISTKLVIRTVFSRGEFLRLVGAPN